MTTTEPTSRHLSDADLGLDAIRDLRTEAASAGDSEQVAICDRALDGDQDALSECFRVIDAAREASEDAAAAIAGGIGGPDGSRRRRRPPAEAGGLMGWGAGPRLLGQRLPGPPHVGLRALSQVAVHEFEPRPLRGVLGFPPALERGDLGRQGRPPLPGLFAELADLGGEGLDGLRLPVVAAERLDDGTHPAGA